MPLRTSKGGHDYRLRPVKAGERIEVDQEHVGLMLTLGWLEPEPGEPGYLAPAPRGILGRARREPRAAKSG